MGRRRRAAAAEEREGQPNKRPRSGPPPALLLAKPPPAPRGMSAAARACWRRVAKLLVDHRVLSHLDLDSLRVYCELWASYERLTNTPADGPGWLAAQKLIGSTADRLGRLWARFGMTPLDRQQLDLTEPAEDDGDLERAR